MSDNEEDAEEKPFSIEIAKQGRAVCKKCKEKCLQGELRIAKLMANPFGSGKMKAWHHVNCMFEQFLKQRQTTKRIESPEDIDGWDKINDEHKSTVLKKIDESNQVFAQKFGTKVSPVKKNKIETKASSSNSSNLIEAASTSSSGGNSSSSSTTKTDTHRDNTFRQFRKLVADISNENSYISKTNLVKKMFTEGSDGSGFKGDIILWCKLLLPGVVKTIYNLQSKQLIKLFSRIFHTSQNKMLTHLEQGDVSETIEIFFEQSDHLKPAKKSTLTLNEVNDYLENLSNLTKEEDQIAHFKVIAKKCTANDLKTIIRLIKHDLRMNAGAKHVLDGVHPDAYEAYLASRDIPSVISRCLKVDKNIKHSNVKATISLSTPVLPMLAEACKSVEQAFKKCPNGMFAEIKYDGERVQVHKHGTSFKYFSRSLKAVLPHKVAHFKDYIPKAFPHANDLILDTEILMMDTTGKPLPFGTLGKHKKSEFKDATVCLFVFDCIYYNGDILTDKPIQHRKKILKETMTEIPNHVVFSEMEEIHKVEDLSLMIAKVLKLGLEGLVLKDLKSIYEPGKRHWLKVKKDYLFEGAMADSADLIVLGAWYGTGKKGGMMSVFLMGCYDNETNQFCTVTKVHTGHDDETLKKLQSELDMIKISGDVDKVPLWLSCNKPMVPDFVAKNPKMQPVWEITGAEFTQHEVHTADGISIRFPRVTKIRQDKTWETATTLEELKKLFAQSKEFTDVSLLMRGINSNKDETKSDDSSKIDNNNDNNKKDDSLKKAKQPLLTDYVKVDKKRKLPIDNKESESNKKKKNDLYNFDVTEILSKIANPLPNYFENVKLALFDEKVREKYQEWIRYFVAYGGEVLKPQESSLATHVLHTKNVAVPTKIQFPATAKHVTIEWIIQTVLNERLYDYRPYSVCWKSSIEY